MKARIYRPTHTAMQSGKAPSTEEWLLKILPSAPLMIDPLMGWIGQTDTTQQLKLSFPTQEEAIAYAKKNNFEYELIEPKMRIIKPKSYAANFSYNRVA